jgi:hypothetical protein
MSASVIQSLDDVQSGQYANLSVLALLVYDMRKSHVFLKVEIPLTFTCIRS